MKLGPCGGIAEPSVVQAPARLAGRGRFEGSHHAARHNVASLYSG